MKRGLQERLIALNLQFYQKTGEMFALTRQAGWPGWEKLFLILKSKLPRDFNILDLGCGNGRFLNFLTKHSPTPSFYLGIDNDVYLLERAKKISTTFKTEYKKQDIISKPPILFKKRFDLIVVMGLIHHIPDRKMRDNFLQAGFLLLKPGGYLAVSFWRMNSDVRQRNKIVPWETIGIKTAEVETNDYLVSWQKSKNYRYIHSFGDLELNEIITRSPMRPLVTFLADGKTQSLNQYIVWQKIL